MMVVPVLITSCQVSENSKNGPESSQTTIRATAAKNAQGDPARREIKPEILRNTSFILLLIDRHANFSAPSMTTGILTV
jgi:hypothetical protein